MITRGRFSWATASSAAARNSAHARAASRQLTLRLLAGRCDKDFSPQPERNLFARCRFYIGNKQKGAQMTKITPAVVMKLASVLVLGTPLLLGACAPVVAAPPPCNACAAMDRANAAYALAQQAENDAQAARAASSTMYQRTLHKGY
jgi:hypothetical protein